MMETLARHGFPVEAFTNTPGPNSSACVPRPCGLRQGERRRIAMAPGVDSLNAATAAAIALYCPGASALAGLVRAADRSRSLRRSDRPSLDFSGIRPLGGL